MVNKMAISKFGSGDFWEKKSTGGGLGALQFFGYLKRALELFISIRMIPLTKGPIRTNHPPRTNQSMRSPLEKKTRIKKQINMHP